MESCAPAATLLVALAFLASAASPLTAASAGDAAALLAFKIASVESDPRGSLENWGGNGDPCSWSGVTCSKDDGRVVQLDLSNRGLVGQLGMGNLMSLPALLDVNLRGNFFYGNLSHPLPDPPAAPCALKSVDLSGNNFTTAVAGQFLAPCSSLLGLNLSRNSISGGLYPFPPTLRSLDLSRNQIADDGLLNYSLGVPGCGALSYLNMSGNQLVGRLPAVSAACGNLETLDLSYNRFSGEIPQEFVMASPPSLKQLLLSSNNFSGDFSGFQFGNCGNLTALDLSRNALEGGGLPRSLTSCRRLEWVDLSHNKFRGGIPSFWGGFTGLKHLSLSHNNFSGEIPAELADVCRTLTELDLSGNMLAGGLPPAFAQCTVLQSLDLSHNQLSGDFVEKVVGAFSELRYLDLSFNNITGTVPAKSLANCTSLESVDFSSNELTGGIPSQLCSWLPSLQKLLLPSNFLSGAVPPELGSCENLRSLDLSFNQLKGPIPPDIWSLPKLADLVMWANELSGEIPDVLCSNGASLETLILNHNDISGSIPLSITTCTGLIWVSLSGNRLTGGIPDTIGNLENLAILQLGDNSLSGGIPPSLGSCRNLIWLDLTLNQLTGPIPTSLASQTGLIVPGTVSGKQFAFLRNEGGTSCAGSGVIFEFAGIRPERLASFSLVHACPTTRIYTGTAVYTFSGNGSMIYLDLSYNSLSGTIPPNMGAMNYLQVFNLGHNQLTGPIPETFGRLKAVGVLDLSHNHLTGSIPGSLGTLSFLVDFDVSNNMLSGTIPSAGQLMTFAASRYENNSGLCGVPLPPCRPGPRSGIYSSGSGDRRRFLGGSMLIIISISALIILALGLAIYKLRKKEKTEEKRASYVESLPTSGANSWKLSGVHEPLSINVATFEKPLRKLTFAHLLEATNGFSADSLIGSGGFGEVYKARLKDGCVVAIKKLVHITGQGDREFMAEMETIGKIKHRNLVPLLGYCKVGEERLLVYEYMKHGSLDMVLHDKCKEAGGAPKLNWAARKKIAIGSARGLAFLHHSCIPHIIHRDMKSSNVLLDDNLESRVSDFGMARLMNALDTHLSVSTLAGTPGYVPPEYYQSFRCTTKGDVYSYGVLLLELLSGKRPTDQTEFGDNNLVGWAKQMVKENRSSEIFDPELTGTKSGEAELYRYLKIACQCLDDRPLRRPTMIQVMAMFKELQMDSDSDILEGLPIGASVISESREKIP